MEKRSGRAAAAEFRVTVTKAIIWGVAGALNMRAGGHASSVAEGFETRCPSCSYSELDRRETRHFFREDPEILTTP